MNISPSLIDYFPAAHDGYPDELAAEDTPDALREVCGEAARDFPAELWIEPRHWAEKAADNDAYGTWAKNHLDRFTNQNPTHECTCHALRALFEACWNKHRGILYPGPKKDHRYEESARLGSVWVSPLSIYAEANPRQWGGASIRGVLEIAVKRGFLPEKIQPADYGFEHTLQGTTGKGGVNQSRGNWVSVRNFPSGWKETAKGFRPLEVCFPDTWEQAVCLVLHGYGYEVGRNGHAVPWDKWYHRDSIMGYSDSYDVERYDSLRTVKSAYRGGFSILSTTVPDHWAAIAV